MKLTKREHIYTIEGTEQDARQFANDKRHTYECVQVVSTPYDHRILCLVNYDEMEKRIIHTREQAEQYAKDWQCEYSDQPISYTELAEWGAIFEELANRFDLVEVFKENAII